MDIKIGRGTIIADRYEIDRKINTTILGDLYRARDKKDESWVNIEILGAVGNEDEKVERFLQEVQLTKSLEHPNLVTPLDVGWDSQIYFLVSSHLSGATLEERLSSGKLEEAEALSILLPVTRALNYLWQEKEIIHRDIKPENIFMAQNKQVKLTGFGIAKSNESKPIGLTGDGFTIGTPEYMSPEQIRADDDLDFRSDMYSLGCVLYESLVGEIPFPETAPILIMQKHLDQNHKPLKSRNPTITRTCSKVVDRMLSKDRDDRYSSWTELINEINTHLRTLTQSETTRFDWDSLPQSINQPTSKEEIQTEDPTKKVSPLNPRTSEIKNRESIISYLVTTSQLDRSEMQDPAGAPKLPAEKYQIQKEIATGGMGRVNLVKDHDINRNVAMKTILPAQQKSPQIISKFVEEAQTIGRLEHPNIVPVYDVGLMASGQVYFTMKYVKGMTLGEIIEKLKQGDSSFHSIYTWTRRAQIIQEICDAIQFAHSKNIIHRDLKPANIMIGEFGEVIVMDWGLAKVIRTQNSDKKLNDLTSHILAEKPHISGKDMVGTPAYMSPEQALGQTDSLSYVSDVYAIGVLMYEFFSLNKPFPGESLFEVLSSIIKSEPLALRKFKNPVQGIPPAEIQYIITRAMDKKPGNRHPSPAELKDEIQMFLDGKYPIRCPHTALKRCTTEFGHAVDNHGKLIIIAALIPIIFLLAVLVSRFF